MKKHFLNIVLLCSSCFLWAQSFAPDIENYSIETYKADNQNWDVDVDNNGVVFIANNKGLLRYNGQSWQLFELPNKTTVRSVLCVNDRVYTGSYEEFGFWKKDGFGDYFYTSLNRYFETDNNIDNEQFWQIVRYKDKIIFKSFAKGLYIYDGEHILYVENSFRTYDISIYQNELLVTNTYRGLERLVNGKLEPFKLSGISSYQPSSVANIASIRDLLFFYDSEQGGFFYDSKVLMALPDEINAYLNKNVLNKVAFTDENNIILGTIKDGLAIYNIKAKSIQYINKSSGLINNTVLGLKFDKENLWLALDNGVTKVDFKTPLTYYKDFTGKLGTVYDVVFYKNNYYLGSNTGVYKFSKTGKLSLINGSEGHVWDLSILGGQLIVGHNDGSFLIENDIWSDRLSDRGVFCSIEVPDKENWFLQGTYYGINLLKLEKDGWQFSEIDNIPFLVNNIVYESDKVIWVTHPYKGVYRILLSEDYKAASKIVPYGDTSGFKQYQTTIYSINNNIILNNSGKWFKYYKEKDSIGAFNEFVKYKDQIIVGKEEKGTWFNNRNDNILAFVNNDFKEKFNINMVEVKRGLVAKYEKVIFQNDSLRLINLNDGFAIFNIKKLPNEKSILKTPAIDKIYSKNRSISINDSSVIRIPFKEARSLTIESYLPNTHEINLNYILSGRIDEIGKTNKGKLILQNLPFGDYTLTLKSPYAKENFDFDKELNFTVLPPWYLSNLMKLLYLILTITIVYVYHKINKTKIRRQQIESQRTYIRDNQKKIQEIEKQNLEKDLLNKRRELTSSTETVIKKNEIIILLRNELNRLLNVSPNKNRTKKLIDISKNKKDADDEWKAFETNFNELHEDFFKRLAAQYPKLTTKDLKLCAYIKTGLTSKEIAPLMGIKTRGVEIHRYRLRKKIEINSNENISNFLITF